MVAIVSGNRLGLKTTSSGVPDDEGAVGKGGPGDANFGGVNLGQQDQDDYVTSAMPDAALTRTYNAQAQFAGLDVGSATKIVLSEDDGAMQPAMRIIDDSEDDGGYYDAVNFVSNIYRLYLGHPPDSGTRDFWAGQIASFSTDRNTFAAQIINSAEGTQYTASLQAKVNNLYLTELGRSAEPDGLAFWVNLLRQGMTEANLWAGIHNSPEGVNYRSSQISRATAMHNYNAQGNAIVNRVPGDTLQSLSQEAYGGADRWWVLAQANGVMTDEELSALSTVVIPNIANYSGNPQTIWIGDTGYAYEYAKRATGEEFLEYYIPAASQLDPREYEDNPSWLSGLSFVNGNDRWNRSDFYISRGAGTPLLPSDYWKTHDTSVMLTADEINIPLKAMLFDEIGLISSGDQ